MSTELIQGLFCVSQTHYNLRKTHYFVIPRIDSVYDGSEGISSHQNKKDLSPFYHKKYFR